MVFERSESGARVQRTYAAPHFFYVLDENGEYESITGAKLKKLTFKNRWDCDDAAASYSAKFESDLNPLEKLLMSEYLGKLAPKLTIGFVDIEVDYHPDLGFPRPANPYAPVNALTLYRSDVNGYFTLLVPPPGWDGKFPEELLAQNYFICADERELLTTFLDLLEEVDVISGWNSEFFDVPYIGKRIEMQFGQLGFNRLSFTSNHPPRWGERDRFKGSKEKEIVLDLGSRVHLDYLRLFMKFNLGGRQSYALGAIAEEEIDVPKVKYEGTLYELYRRDFVHFAIYNRGDVVVLVKLNDKFKYIELANEMVHNATVNFNAIFGSVQLIDTAIINYAHEKLGKIVTDRPHLGGERVEGALVLTPKIGLHRWIGSCDINSLYPSTYRSLNLSPEKIVGQLLEYEAGWRAVHEASLNPEDDLKQIKKVTLRLEGASPDDDLHLTARALIELLQESKFSLSAYGTILDQSCGEGLLPAVFTYWFKGRREMQAEKKRFGQEAESLLRERGVELGGLEL